MEKSGLAYSILSFFAGLSGPVAYSAIFFVLIICGFGVPIPEDVTIISAGILVSTGSISLIGAYIVCFVGILGGDFTLFYIGRRYGKKAFTWPIFRRILTPKRIALAEEKVQSNAKFICFIARFLPGIRSVVFLTSGAMKVPIRTFFIQDGFAALISVPVWIELGRFAGNNLDKALQIAKEFHIYIFIGIAVAILFYYLWKKYFKRKFFAN